eukprot:GHVP01065144.1.p1 GENE.GHVP01065144.1~~GHVP01065144.1.p1  ORF type:complete len:156 (+),score=23.55 GHVP01065144.1:499-966(+)
MDCRICLRPNKNVLVYPEDSEEEMSGLIAESGTYKSSKTHEKFSERRFNFRFGVQDYEVIQFISESAKKSWIFRNDVKYPSVFYKLKQTIEERSILSSIFFQAKSNKTPSSDPSSTFPSSSLPSFSSPSDTEFWSSSSGYNPQVVPEEPPQEIFN